VPRFTFAKRRNVAINLKHGLIAEQLHTAVYDDFAAVFAEMMEFTGPIPVVPKSRPHFGEVDWELGSQERMAAAPNRLV
jgi:hypothetical protein